MQGEVKGRREEAKGEEEAMVHISFYTQSNHKL